MNTPRAGFCFNGVSSHACRLGFGHAKLALAFARLHKHSFASGQIFYLRSNCFVELKKKLVPSQGFEHSRFARLPCSAKFPFQLFQSCGSPPEVQVSHKAEIFAHAYPRSPSNTFASLSWLARKTSFRAASTR